MAEKPLDRLVLLIHYDSRAFRFNAPIEAPDWGLDLFASEAAVYSFRPRHAAGQPSPWDDVFLFDAVNGRSVRVHRYPPASGLARPPAPAGAPECVSPLAENIDPAPHYSTRTESASPSS